MLFFTFYDSFKISQFTRICKENQNFTGYLILICSSSSCQQNFQNRTVFKLITWSTVPPVSSLAASHNTKCKEARLPSLSLGTHFKMASGNPLLTLERMLNGRTTLKTQKLTHNNIICKWRLYFLCIFLYKLPYYWRREFNRTFWRWSMNWILEQQNDSADDSSIQLHCMWSVTVV